MHATRRQHCSEINGDTGKASSVPTGGTNSDTFHSVQLPLRREVQLDSLDKLATL
jgi:hypothetical protein